MNAEQLARLAHIGQLDKSGEAYANHPMRVAANFEPGSAEWEIAWLHDVVEDCGVEVADLRSLFGDEAAEAVALLSRNIDDGRDYYERIKQSPMALKVKLADIADNLDPERLDRLDDKTRARLVKKYEAALAILGGK